MPITKYWVMGRFLTRLFALMGISITTVACYGTPYDEYHEEWGTSGRVVDDKGNAISGIQLSLGGDNDLSDDDGRFSLRATGGELLIQDIDGESNGGEFAARRIILSESDHYLGDIKLERLDD